MRNVPPFVIARVAQARGDVWEARTAGAISRSSAKIRVVVRGAGELQTLYRGGA